MEFIFNYIWEQGMREQNEDSLCIRQVTKGNICYLLAVVCDGIGGLAEGENASSYVVNCMMDEMEHLLLDNRGIAGKNIAGVGIMDRKRIKRIFYRRIYRCHKILLEYGKERNIRLGTTISMIFIAGNRGYLFHVGDSSIFIGKQKLKRQTEIQHSDSGALLQAIGVGKNPKPVFKIIHIKKEMVILIASDGFYKKSESKVSSSEWFKQLFADENVLGDKLREVTSFVQEKGERDNISAILIKVK